MSKAMTRPQHAIQVVARLTGLSAHVIRVWEKRYGAVTPGRTPGARRLYSEEELERLRLLRRLTISGYRIGDVARQPTEQLRRWVEVMTQSEGGGESERGEGRATAPVGVEEDMARDWVERCFEPLMRMDGVGLARMLQRAEVELGLMGVLLRVIVPLAREMGERWRSGHLTAAQEHAATFVLRTQLGRHLFCHAPGVSAPGIVVATLVGQLHELGALMTAALAAALGWRVVYLGTSLPGSEIAGAAQRVQARAVALSLVYPEADPVVATELLAMKTALPEGFPLLVGGRAVASYKEALDTAGAQRFETLQELGGSLDRIYREGRTEWTPARIGDLARC